MFCVLVGKDRHCKKNYGQFVLALKLRSVILFAIFQLVQGTIGFLLGLRAVAASQNQE